MDTIKASLGIHIFSVSARSLADYFTYFNFIYIFTKNVVDFQMNPRRCPAAFGLKRNQWLLMNSQTNAKPLVEHCSGLTMFWTYFLFCTLSTYIWSFIDFLILVFLNQLDWNL